MRRFAFTAIALLVGGCSLFVDLDGLSVADGGSGDALASDAGVTDASAIDAADASDASTVDAARFTCPDASIVCDDFDESGLGARWSRVTIQNGTLGIDNSAAFSPPNSLLITLPDNPDGLTRYNRLEKDIGAMSSIDCELEIRLDATDDPGKYDVRPFAFELYPSGFNNYDVHVNLGSAELSFEQNTDTGLDGGSLTRTDSFAPVTIGKWMNMRVTTNFQTVQIFIDGSKVYDQAVISPIPSTGSGKIHVGQGYDTEPPSWTYRVDDVLCTGN